MNGMKCFLCYDSDALALSQLSHASSVNVVDTRTYLTEDDQRLTRWFGISRRSFGKTFWNISFVL